MLCGEHLNSVIPLETPPAEVGEQFRRYSLDFETGIVSTCVPLVLDFVAKAAHSSGERIPIDFREVRSAFVDLGCLQRLPAARGAVERQISGHSVGV